MTMKQPLKLQK